MTPSYFQYTSIMPFSYSHTEELLDLLRLYVWPYFLFVFLFFVPPQVRREETAQLSQALYKLHECRCMIWISFARTMALDITMGIFVTLFYVLCFFNNQESNEVVMLEVFWDNYGMFCLNRCWWNKSLFGYRCLKYVYLYLSWVYLWLLLINLHQN